jgi:SAM-dependent methyltransferase
VSPLRRRAPRLRFDRPEPVSAVFGLDRGAPIDRYYIEGFLAAHADRVRGRVLEIGDATYTARFGGDAVTEGVVLHAVEGNAEATLVGDLQDAATLPKGAFDCVILTQTLQFLPEARAAVANVHAALAPGGCVLATLPGITQISRYDDDRWGDFWRVTGRGARHLFETAFAPEAIEIDAPGNAAVACAALQGLAVEELEPSILDARHPDYPLIVTVVATRR